MTIYFISSFFSVLFGFYGSYGKDKNLAFVCRISLLIFLFILLAFRYGVGVDYFHYESIYLSINNGGITYKYTEPVFYFLNKLCSPFELLIFVSSFLTFFFFAISCNNRKFFFYDILLFYALIYLGSFCLIRQMLACVISIYAFRKYQYKFTRCIFFLILASLIHRTFWSVVFIYILSFYVKISAKMFFTIVIVSFVVLYCSDLLLFFLNKTPLKDKLGTDMYIMMYRIGKVVFLRYIVLFCISYLYFKQPVKNNLIVLFLLAIFISEFAGTRFVIMASRMPQTFYAVFFIFISNFDKSFLNRKLKIKMGVYKSVFITVFLLLFTILYAQLFTGTHLNEIVPYDSIFFNTHTAVRN